MTDDDGRGLGDARALDDVKAAGTDEPPPSTRRKRRNRRKPKMQPWLRPYIDKALERHKRREASPGVAIEPRKSGEGYRFTSPHDDVEAWEIQLCDAFGTRSASLYQVFIQQLASLARDYWDEAGGYWRPSQQQLNAALAIVAGIKPRNAMEAALAAQMTAVHFMTMKVSGEVMSLNGHTDARAASVAAKLARTYAMQMGALSKARGKTGRQTIKVKVERHDHRHQHVHMHGERTDRGVVDLEGQPVATSNRKSGGSSRNLALTADVSPAREHGNGSTLRGQDSLGCVVPIRSGQRQG